ncbi:MAG: hypothetical protein U1G07_27485 [Verrucomicrobiota bacterium]
MAVPVGAENPTPDYLTHPQCGLEATIARVVALLDEAASAAKSKLPLTNGIYAAGIIRAFRASR